MKLRRVESYNIEMWCIDIETRAFEEHTDCEMDINDLENIINNFVEWCENHNKKFDEILVHLVISYVADED